MTAVIEKAVALVVRDGAAGPEVLALEHPLAGVQVPKGTVQTGEAPRDAAMRELHEETGMRLGQPRFLLSAKRRMSPWVDQPDTVQDQLWHVFLFQAEGGESDAWRHVPSGGGDETGLEFRLFWLPVDGVLGLALGQQYAFLADVLRKSLKTDIERR